MCTKKTLSLAPRELLQVISVTKLPTPALWHRDHDSSVYKCSEWRSPGPTARGLGNQGRLPGGGDLCSGTRRINTS